MRGRGRNTRCFDCQEFGHIARNCPRTADARATENARNQSGGSRENPVFTHMPLEAHDIPMSAQPVSTSWTPAVSLQGGTRPQPMGIASHEQPNWHHPVQGVPSAVYSQQQATPPQSAVQNAMYAQQPPPPQAGGQNIYAIPAQFLPPQAYSPQMACAQPPRQLTGTPVRNEKGELIGYSCGGTFYPLNTLSSHVVTYVPSAVEVSVSFHGHPQHVMPPHQQGYPGAQSVHEQQAVYNSPPQLSPSGYGNATNAAQGPPFYAPSTSFEQSHFQGQNQQFSPPFVSQSEQVCAHIPSSSQHAFSRPVFVNAPRQGSHSTHVDIPIRIQDEQPFLLKPGEILVPLKRFGYGDSFEHKLRVMTNHFLFSFAAGQLYYYTVDVTQKSCTESLKEDVDGSSAASKKNEETRKKDERKKRIRMIRDAFEECRSLLLASGESEFVFNGIDCLLTAQRMKMPFYNFEFQLKDYGDIAVKILLSRELVLETTPTLCKTPQLEPDFSQQGQPQETFGGDSVGEGEPAENKISLDSSDRVNDITEWTENLDLSDSNFASTGVVKKFVLKCSEQPTLDEISLSCKLLDDILERLPRNDYQHVGSSFYFYDQQSIEGGCSVRLGFRMTVQRLLCGFSLNLDFTGSAFYDDCECIAILEDIVKGAEDYFFGAPLTERHHSEFLSRILGSKVVVKPMRKNQPHRTYRVRGVSIKGAHALPTEKLNSAGQFMSVVDYYADVYGYQLRYPQLPCLEIGYSQRKSYFPLELCRVTGRQCHTNKLTEYQTQNMIEITHRKAPQRKNDIERIISDKIDTEALSRYNLEISGSLRTLTARHLAPPVIVYARNSERIRRGKDEDKERKEMENMSILGRWDLRSKKLFKGAMVGKSVILYRKEHWDNWPNGTFGSLNELPGLFRDMGKSAGMSWPNIPAMLEYRGKDAQEAVSIALSQVRAQGFVIAIVLLPAANGNNVYEVVKKTGDIYLGMITQCMKLSCLKEVLRKVTQHSSLREKKKVAAAKKLLANFCLNLNGKLGGINSIVTDQFLPATYFDSSVPEAQRFSSMNIENQFCRGEATMFVGAFVNHQHSEKADAVKPAIAAIVGSFDENVTQYKAVVRTQNSRDDTILDLANMMFEVVEYFVQHRGRPPRRIVFYHYGIKEHMLEKVLNAEVPAIRNAFPKDQVPLVTFIALQRCHRTRFFCEDEKQQAGSGENVPAGLVIDTDIVHPCYADFFLVSHCGDRGTSRPSRYFVLYNDNNFSMDELQRMTYYSCFLYFRCTNSIPAPAPAYYACQAAFRGRFHISEKGELPKLHEDMKNTMYFI